MGTNLTQRILILEDNEREREALDQLLETWLLQEHLDGFRVESYGCYESFMKAFRENPAAIVFLDIFLCDGPKGIRAAREVHDESPDTAIVFVTTSMDFAVEGFAVNAIHYCVKPITMEVLDECMARCRKKLRWGEAVITLKMRAGIFHIRAKDILYAESAGHSVSVRVKGTSEPIAARMSMTAAQEIFKDERFLRVTRGFIINMDHVEEMMTAECRMSDGRVIPLSRSERANLRQVYRDYIFLRI